MPDLVITATSVIPDTDLQTAQGTLGEAATAGQPVYLDTTTTPSLLKKADNNATPGVTDQVVGILIAGGAANQRVIYQFGGHLTLGATLVKGELYCLSSNAGGICPKGDLAAGMRVTVLGIAEDTAKLRLGPVGVSNVTM